MPPSRKQEDDSKREADAAKKKNAAPAPAPKKKTSRSTVSTSFAARGLMPDTAGPVRPGPNPPTPSREAVMAVATPERGGVTPGARPGGLAPDIGPDAMGLDRAFTPGGIAEQYSSFPKPVEGWQPRPGAALGGAPSQRASANGDTDVAKAADTARRAVANHGTTEKESVDLNNAAGRKAEAEVYQSLYGGEKPKDYGRVASIVLPNGKKVYGDPESLKARVGGEGPGRTGWGPKPGQGDETEQGIRVGEDSTGVILGSKPGGAALSRALDAAATSGRPYSEALRANIDSIIGPVSSDPIQVADQIRHRQMLEEKVRMEQGRELGDVQHDTNIAQNLQAQSLATEDPLARERIRAQGQYGDAYLKTQADTERDNELKQRLAPIFAAMAAATDPADQARLFQMAQLMIASYGRTAPSQSNQGLGFFGFQPTGGAPAAEAAK